MTSENDDSDTHLLNQLKTGDKDAANRLTERYFERVVRAARRRIGSRRLRGVDSEDIAASVFESVWKKADHKHFQETDLTSADEFWRLLCKLIQFKAEDHLRRERAEKRGGGMVRGESIFCKPADESGAGISGFAGDELSPSEIVAIKENHSRMIDALEDEILKEIVTMRMEDRKVSEIAAHFDKSDRWVKRKLALIREIWQHLLEEST